MDYCLSFRLDKNGRYWYDCKCVCLNMELTTEKNREQNRSFMEDLNREMILQIGEVYGEVNPWTQEWLINSFRKAPYMHPDEVDF